MTENSKTSPTESRAPCRFYVTLTWDDWPEGGSYGTVVEARDHEAAEQMAREEMARSRIDERGDGDALGIAAVEQMVEDYRDKWDVVDCYDLDQHMTHHMRPLHKAAPDLLAALTELRRQLRDHLKFDVKKHYSLMVADAAADKAIARAEGRT